MPKISVIIPVYNTERYLRQTLDSVLSQSLREIEVICVDDGSSDQSPAILQEYAGKDSRVKVLRQQNLHAGVARNVGLAAASGEYVHFLDADDYVLDYAYEALYNKAVKYDLDLLKFSSVTYDILRNVAVNLPDCSLTCLRPGDFHRLLTLDNGSPIYKINMAPWSGIYRRSFLDRQAAGFSDLLCFNDRPFFCKVITAAGRMMIARDRLVVHRIGIPESLNSICALHSDCRFRAVEIISQQLTQDQVPEAVIQRIMQREFTELFAWYKELHGNPQVGQEISRKTKRFVETYRGVYGGMLAELYEITLRQVAAGIPEAAPAVPAAIQKERCAAPKVSVVLPIYNVEDYLNEALYSLSVQTLEEMEFICVNDGSTDGSMIIMKEYAALDKRFQILDGPNGGYGKAMNRGIDAACGEYLGILEPDDFVPEEMYHTLYQIAHREKADLVKADFYRFSVKRDGYLRKKLNRLSSNKSYYNRILCPGDDIATFKFAMNTWSGIYSLKFLNQWHIRHNETPGASYQDNGFWFQTFCRAERAWFVDKPFYMNRRDNPNSSMFSRNKLYCVTEEYDFIWQWMQTDPVLVEKFSSIFYAKKFTNFMVTYRRLAPEYQREYLHHLCDEFRPAMEQGLLDEKLFGAIFWKQVNEILDDPDAYYDKLRVSVIMPVYNASRYIRQTLDCLLVRNEVQFEIICVDDGSTDNSLAILREYENRDSRVRVFTQPNSGAGAARNNGMQYARGEYLSFLDADDFIEPEMLRLAYEKASLYHTDITVFRCDQYLEQKDTLAPAAYTINKSLLPPKQPFAGSDVSKDIFKVFVGWAWDKLFRADFIRENGLKFQEQRTTNDMLFVFSAVVKAGRINTMDNILAHHRRGGDSLSVTREKSWDCFYHALCALRRQLKDWNLYDHYERDFINYSLHFSLWNVTTLRGATYHLLYDRLVSEWFDDLGITGHDEFYFYNKGEYRKLKLILASTSEEFLFNELDSTRNALSDKQKENDRNRSKVRQQETKLKQAYAEKSDLDRRLKRTITEKTEINQQLQQTCAKNSELERKLRQICWEKTECGIQIKELDAKLQQLQAEKAAHSIQLQALQDQLKEQKQANASLRKKLKRLTNSRSYRLGRALTAPFRWLRKLFRR